MCCLTGCNNSSSPTAQNSGPSGSDGATCADGSSPPCPGPPPVLEIVDRKTGAVVSGTTQDKIVGQKIELLVRANPSAPLSNIRWSVPGQRVKNYTQSTTTGAKTDLATGDLQGTNLDFFWIAGGNQAVQVSATVRGASLTTNVTHNVLAPTGVTMTTSTGAVEVSNPGFPGSGLELHFGTNTTPGIAFTFKATAPAGGGGQIASTQLIDTHRTRTDNAAKAEVFSSSGVFVLDNREHYGGVITAISAASSATWNSDDSPGTPLTSNLSQKAERDRFKTYFMYRPTGADSIWVTIGFLEWNWAGQTARTGAIAANTWGAPTGVSQSNNPSGSASSELPTWTSNFTGISWR